MHDWFYCCRNSFVVPLRQEVQKTLKEIDGKDDEKERDGQVPTNSSSPSLHASTYPHRNNKLSPIILHRHPNSIPLDLALKAQTTQRTEKSGAFLRPQNSRGPTSLPSKHDESLKL